MDWSAWHDDYGDPDSWLAQRLRVVQTWIRTVLDEAAPGPLRVLSLCAGQGRDLLPVLADHPRRADVRARLVELDPRNTAVAAEAALAAGLTGVQVVTGDAALTSQCVGMAPADLVLLCGIFGNITAEDIARTVATCPQLCRTGGSVIWTRHRGTPDRVPQICGWFEDLGFERRWVSGTDVEFGVGVHRNTGEPRPLDEHARMFTFVGYEVLGET